MYLILQDRCSLFRQCWARQAVPYEPLTWLMPTTCSRCSSLYVLNDNQGSSDFLLYNLQRDFTQPWSWIYHYQSKGSTNYAVRAGLGFLRYIFKSKVWLSGASKNDYWLVFRVKWSKMADRYTLIFRQIFIFTYLFGKSGDILCISNKTDSFIELFST